MFPLPVPAPSPLNISLHCIALIVCYAICFEYSLSSLDIITSYYLVHLSPIIEKMSQFEYDLTAAEEELLLAREEVRVDGLVADGSGPTSELVAGGVQVPDALEADPANVQVGELVGSGQVIHGGGAVGDALYQEWRYSSKIQRDLAARHLMAVSLFYIGWEAFPNTYICQIVKARGACDWVLLHDTRNAKKILHDLGSRLRNHSCLLWCVESAVLKALCRAARKKGMCVGWCAFDPKVYEPPRWPCLRGESALEELEVVRRFKKKVWEVRRDPEVKAVPTPGDMDGWLAKIVDDWEEEQVWWPATKGRKAEKTPDYAVCWPARLWGCPLRVVGDAGEPSIIHRDVPVDDAMEGIEDAVDAPAEVDALPDFVINVPRKEGVQPPPGIVDGEGLEEARAAVDVIRQRRKESRIRQHRNRKRRI